MKKSKSLFTASSLLSISLLLLSACGTTSSEDHSQPTSKTETSNAHKEGEKNNTETGSKDSDNKKSETKDVATQTMSQESKSHSNADSKTANPSTDDNKSSNDTQKVSSSEEKKSSTATNNLSTQKELQTDNNSNSSVASSATQPNTNQATNKITNEQRVTPAATNESEKNISPPDNSLSQNNEKSGAINRPSGAWVDKFEKDLYAGYHVTPSRYKNIGSGYWEVWVKEADTGENGYVTVNQNTGNFHG